MKTYQEKMREYNRKSYKKCRVQRLKEKKLYCSKNKLEIKEKRRERYQIRKKEIFRVLGGKCKHCGNSDIRVLQIDHINGGGHKEIKKSKYKGTLNFYYKQMIENQNAFLEKYQLLCANCNWIKRSENKEY